MYLQRLVDDATDRVSCLTVVSSSLAARQRSLHHWRLCQRASRPQAGAAAAEGGRSVRMQHTAGAHLRPGSPDVPRHFSARIDSAVGALPGRACRHLPAVRTRAMHLWTSTHDEVDALPVRGPCGARRFQPRGRRVRASESAGCRPRTGSGLVLAGSAVSVSMNPLTPTVKRHTLAVRWRALVV